MMKINYILKKIMLKAGLILLCSMIWPPQMKAGNQAGQMFPSYQLADTAVTLVYKDTLILLSDMSFELPVRITPGVDLSAVTMGFYFPSQYLEITGLVLADSTIGYYYNVTDSLLILSWADINPIVLADHDTILTLKMKTLDLSGLIGTIKLGLYESTEFADQNANIIEGVELEVPEIQLFRPDTVDTVTGYYAHVYPNPFKDYATIYFGLNEESEVKILIYNTDGILIMDMGDKTYPEGDHQVKLYGLDFSKGVYLLKFEIRNSEGKKEEMFKIMSIR
jgi:hypothetical protein